MMLVEPLRFSLYRRLNVEALIFTAAVGFVFPTLTIVGDSLAKGLMPREAGGAAGE